MNASTTQVTLTGLNEYTNYNITVVASTVKGAGIVSNPIIVITDEDSKFTSVYRNFEFLTVNLLIANEYEEAFLCVCAWVGGSSRDKFPLQCNYQHLLLCTKSVKKLFKLQAL